MAELLPCPFCGGEARIIVVEKGVHSIIQCTTSYCGFMRHSFNNGDTDEYAALRLTTAWNTRTPKERDVQEVRHGKWIGYSSITISQKRRTIQSIIYKCSCCGKSNGRAKSPYCKNCGSKMYGEQAEAENKELEDRK